MGSNAGTGARLRIGLIAPLFESVPPRLYGGTERVVSWLAEELVARGHHVVLFASGDSVTGGELVPIVDRALRLGHAQPQVDPCALHLLAADAARRRAVALDVVHSHIDYLGFPAFEHAGAPFLTTLHGRLDLLGLADLYARSRLPLVSISDAQRAPVPAACWLATVPHGLPLSESWRGPGDGGYVAFLGRISPEKRPDVAIRTARRAGVELVIAAKVGAADQGYFKDVIAPLLRDRGVHFIGEVDDRGKASLLGRARALLFPSLWPEPFGLVMIEAMACGTPVIARRCGSIPEVIAHGRTGFICDDDDHLVAAVEQVGTLDRAACRRWVETRFSVQRMADDYQRLYRTVMARADAARAHPTVSSSTSRSRRSTRTAT